MNFSFLTQYISNKILLALFAVLFVLLGANIMVEGKSNSPGLQKRMDTGKKVTPTVATSSPTLSETSGLTPPLSPGVSPSTPPTLTPSLSFFPTLGIKGPTVLFGLGTEADQAMNSRLVRESRVKLLSSWYNGPSDLSWMTPWRNDLIPSLYSKGYQLHLITFTDHPEGPLSTPYGEACGREYPVSDRIVDDMRQLAETFQGNGAVYVTLFTEFQTYPCQDNTWVGSENYYKRLKDQYRKVKDIFHQTAPNAKVAISWGGWQSRWDDPANGSGISLFSYFSDILHESDFIAFQAMESGTNVEDIRRMSRILSSYNKPIMVSHYKPDNASQVTFENDVKAIFTDEFMTEVVRNRLFAFSFMDDVNMNNNEGIYKFIKASVTKYSQ